MAQITIHKRANTLDDLMKLRVVEEVVIAAAMKRRKRSKKKKKDKVPKPTPVVDIADIEHANESAVYIGIDPGIRNWAASVSRYTDPNTNKTYEWNYYERGKDFHYNTGSFIIKF